MISGKYFVCMCYKLTDFFIYICAYLVVWQVNSADSTGKFLRTSNFIEIAFRHGYSPVNLLHIFKTPFPKNTSGRVLLKIELLHFSYNSSALTKQIVGGNFSSLASRAFLFSLFTMLKLTDIQLFVNNYYY